MSGIPNGAWGLMSVVLVCATVKYAEWKSKQEEAIIAQRLDNMFEKIQEELDIVHEELDIVHEELDNMFEKIQEAKTLYMNNCMKQK
jgi:archaellum component FlaF (FlaF/FlaG flagellin family)